MKKLIPLLFFAILTVPLFATHNYAGEITYRQIGDQQIEATITTYTKASSLAADRDTLELCWGDGQCERIGRTNGLNNQGELIAIDVKMNRYMAVHTYPSIGNYTLRLDDPNRSTNILNVNFPNSELIDFSLLTEVYLLNPNSASFNDSPILLQAPVDIAFAGLLFMHSPNAFDEDDDSLVYELITPVDVDNYLEVTEINPGPDNNIDMNSETGLLVWDAPQQPGLYVVTYSVKSYRGDVLIGEVIRDMLIDVMPFEEIAPSITINGILNNETILPVELGDTVRLEIESVDPEVGNSVYLNATSGLFELELEPATFSSITNGNMANATFEWIVQAEHLRLNPYQLVIKTENDIEDNPATSLAVVRFRTVDFVSNLSFDARNPRLDFAPSLVTQGQAVIHYDAVDEEQHAYHIYNSAGKLLKNGFLFAGRTDLDLNGLPWGVYYFNTEIKGQLVTKSFVIGR